MHSVSVCNPSLVLSAGFCDRRVIHVTCIYNTTICCRSSFIARIRADEFQVEADSLAPIMSAALV